MPAREGRISELKSIVPCYIVQDNNLLACSKAHIQKVFEMLKAQYRAISFNGGLDARFIRPWHLDLFRLITISELWNAYDEESSMRAIKWVAQFFRELRQWKKRSHVMIGMIDGGLKA